MSTERTEAEEITADLVRELIGAVTVLSNRFRRKRISDAVLAGVVAVLVAFVGLYYFVELPNRRSDTHGQISNLACYAVRLRPPGYSPTSDALRAKYHCPPYDPSLATTAPAAPGSAATSAPTGGAQRPSAAPAPSAAPSAGASARRPASGHTASARAAATPTPGRRVASTGGRDASSPIPATRTPLVQLPSIPLCSLRVAGIGLCRTS